MLGDVHRTVSVGLIAVFALVAAGCGGGSEAVRRQPLPADGEGGDGQKTDRRPLSYYEATLRPTDFDKEVQEVERIHIEEREREELIIPRDSLAMVEETVLGFRIQVLSTSNVDDAEQERMQAQQLFLNDTVYVVYDPPVYKVRVGDFPNRLEANGRLPDVQERGYRDAWVVPDNVVSRKWVPVRREVVE
jgi:hypothetical protein